MDIEQIAKESNQSLIGLFVSNLRYDFSTDYAPSIYPEWSEDTVKLWNEIESRMEKPTVLTFDREKCIREIMEEINEQRRITKTPDYATSYHIGIIYGMTCAWKIIEENVHRGDTDDAS